MKFFKQSRESFSSFDGTAAAAQLTTVNKQFRSINKQYSELFKK
jgi:hypothetical protein